MAVCAEEVEERGGGGGVVEFGLRVRGGAEARGAEDDARGGRGGGVRHGFGEFLGGVG